MSRMAAAARSKRSRPDEGAAAAVCADAAAVIYAGRLDEPLSPRSRLRTELEATAHAAGVAGRAPPATRNCVGIAPPRCARSAAGFDEALNRGRDSPRCRFNPHQRTGGRMPLPARISAHPVDWLCANAPGDEPGAGAPTHASRPSALARSRNAVICAHHQRSQSGEGPFDIRAGGPRGPGDRQRSTSAVPSRGTAMVEYRRGSRQRRPVVEAGYANPGSSLWRRAVAVAEASLTAHSRARAPANCWAVRIDDPAWREDAMETFFSRKRHA